MIGGAVEQVRRGQDVLAVQTTILGVERGTSKAESEMCNNMG